MFPEYSEVQKKRRKKNTLPAYDFYMLKLILQVENMGCLVPYISGAMG